MTREISASVAAVLLLVACGAHSAVQEYFAQSKYSYPLQVSAPAKEGPRLVCPGCEEPERLAAEHEALLRSGLEFIETGLSADYLGELAVEGAEAYLVTDAYLYEDPPGAEIGLAVRLSAFKLASLETGEIYIPHELHSTATGEVLELSNILILKPTGDGWEYRGWVF